MSCYYYRIKSYTNSYYWMDVHKGIVYADSAKNAKNKVNDIINEDITIEVVKKKRGEQEPGDFKVIVLLCTKEWENFWTVKRICKECSCEYVVIDQHSHGIDATQVYCSEPCKVRFRLVERDESFANYVLTNKHPTIIYKITERSSGKCYIGQTKQAFTFRWYQHFFNAGDCKFHKAIRASDPTAWTFEVVEMIEDKRDQSFINGREAHYINHFNSLIDRFNSTNFKTSKEEE